MLVSSWSALQERTVARFGPTSLPRSLMRWQLTQMVWKTWRTAAESPLRDWAGRNFSMASLREPADSLAKRLVARALISGSAFCISKVRRLAGMKLGRTLFDSTASRRGRRRFFDGIFARAGGF